jgi:hypothetical protein
MKAKDFGLNRSCYYCNSEHLSETNYGYVCTSCGTDQELTKFENNKNEVHSFAINITTLGTEREREISNNSSKIWYLSKLDFIKSHKEQSIQNAFICTKTILEKLGRSYREINVILKKYRCIRPYFRPGTKFRNPEKAIPCIIYFYCKEVNVVIDVEVLLENSEISKNEFNEFRNLMEVFWPAYKKRDHRRYILTRIGGVVGYKTLYFQSRRILDKFWSLIKDSKDEVVAGLVVGIALILSKCEDHTLSSICNSLHISQSALQKSIQTKFFNRLGIKDHVKGFKKKVVFLEERGFFKDI